MYMSLLSKSVSALRWLNDQIFKSCFYILGRKWVRELVPVFLFDVSVAQPCHWSLKNIKFYLSNLNLHYCHSSHFSFLKTLCQLLWMFEMIPQICHDAE